MASGPLPAVLALVARLVLLFALMMTVPLAFAQIGHDAARNAFAAGAAITAAAGAAGAWATRRHRRELQPRDGFLLVALTWTVLPAFGAVPLWLAIPSLSVVDAYFEAMSGFTATGATAISGLDTLPLSVNVWRCFMSLIGGLGIVVLAVAILPLLGVGGTQLFRAEMPGPMKDQKLTPRIAETARGLWMVYAVLSLACLLAYRVAGMGWADAFMHMCTTVSLSGFSAHDASFAYFDSPAVEAVAMVFMIASGVSLAMYFLVWRMRSMRALWADVEVRMYLAVLASAVALVALHLWWLGTYDGADALRRAGFQVVSIATTTGYSTVDYDTWPPFAAVLLLLLGCFATCAGSTGGGIKMMRLLLLAKQARRELVRIVHPNVVNPVVLGQAAVSAKLMQSVLAYMMVYGATLVSMTLLLLFSGMDPISAFTAVVACVNNIGPGLGAVGPALNYGGLGDFQTLLLTFGMMLGRIELLPVLVLFTPQFWRG